MTSKGTIKAALKTIRAAKWRSTLTMLGIIIGVASVTTIVSLGEGVKRQVIGQAKQVGTDLVVVRPGKIVQRSADGAVSGVNLLTAFSTGSLSEADYQLVAGTEGVQAAVPFSVANTAPVYDGREYDAGVVIASTGSVPAVINQKVQYGTFFSNEDLNKPVAVIGRSVADNLLQENVPLGVGLKLRGQEFVIRGILEEFPKAPLSPNADLNNVVFIPFDSAKELFEGQTQITQILVKPRSGTTQDELIKDITAGLKESHGGQMDFTVLKQSETLAITNRALDLFTALIGGVAFISLLVGGIGIMNIMLMAVTERTREIGIRKAVGATNRQILNQFWVEALVLSVVGGLLGIVVSLIANYLFHVLTELDPVITWPIMVIATGLAILTGLIFGSVPALKAARKDPIDALRYE